MKISYNWLKEYIELPESPQEIGEMLTMSGLEVAGIEIFEAVPGNLKGLIVGKVLGCEKHPQADRLKIARVDIGSEEPLTIVCGAPNIAEGQKVVVAPVGSTIYPSSSEPVRIKKTRIRGEESVGMICAEDEIGWGQSHEGIMVLDPKLKPGSLLSEHLLGEEDHVIEIDLTPNRSDAISHIGVCRDLKALLHRRIKWPSVEHFQSDHKGQPIQVVIENTRDCPRYSGLSFGNVQVGDSPRWLKQRLRSIGLTPINNIVDITNFVMHELGQPMHAFDADKIANHKVVVKNLDPGTLFTTLDERDRRLNQYDLMICDGQDNGMCIAGVFGGIKSGVTSNTSSIFLESAYFSPDAIRKTAQYHGLKTDASFRYERGTDPNMTVVALKRAAILIKELAGGTIDSDIIDVYPEKIEKKKIAVKYRNVDRLIGKSIARNRIHTILKDLDFELLELKDGIEVLAPLYRMDVTREADVIEEILRIYGYNNIELKPHYSASYVAEFPENDTDKTRFGLSKMLAALGFWEIYTNSLTKPQYAAENPLIDVAKNVEILNKLSEDLGVLRQSLLYTGLESVAYNINHQQPDLRLFEWGKVYQRLTNGSNGRDKYFEQRRLSLFMTGQVHPESWRYKSQSFEFHDLSAVIGKILEKFNISAYNSRVIQNGVFDYGLEFIVSDQSLVQFGKLTTSVCAQADIQQAVFYADFDWGRLVNQPKDGITFAEVSKFPAVRRDLSLVLDGKVSYEVIEKIAFNTESNILKRINVFDVYQGDKIQSHQKAYALSFILQDEQKTLTDKIIDKTMSRLMQSFEEKLGAIIRK